MGIRSAESIGNSPNLPQPPRPSEWKELAQQLTRRELLINTGKTALILYFLQFGGIKAAQSPLGRFLLAQPDPATDLPISIPLTEDQGERTLLVGYGSSYVKGEGGRSPVLITADKVTQSGVGDWVGIEEAVSGSPVSDIPRQVAALEKSATIVDGGRAKLLVTDSGYNSVTDGVLSDRETLSALQYILDRLDHHMSFGDISGFVRKFNDVCDAFFSALEITEDNLVTTDGQIIRAMKPVGAFLYTFPPLDRVEALVHIADRHDPTDRSYEIPIRGDSAREFMGRRVTVNGTNMSVRVVRRLMRENPSTPVVLITLANILGVKDYQRHDEHPNSTSWVKIADQQMEQTQIQRRNLMKLIELNNR